MRGGPNRGLIAALVLAGAAAAGGAGHVSTMPDPTDGFVLSPRRGRDRGMGGHKGKRHADRPRKRSNRVITSRRVKRAHRKARRRA